MKYQRTQVYLEPADHAALVREAADRGISLAELMRELVSAHVSESAPAYGTKSWDAIIGIGGDGPASDVSRHEDEYKAAGFEAMQPKGARLLPPSKRARRSRRSS